MSEFKVIPAIELRGGVYELEGTKLTVRLGIWPANDQAVETTQKGLDKC